MANNTHHVIIDIATTSETTTLPRHQLHDVDDDDDGRLHVSLQTSNHSSSPRGGGGGGGGGGRNSRSPLNSGFWISFEFIFTLSQIIASVIVLNSSRDEHPRAPLFAWIVGYASGCVASIPLLLWRYFARDQNSSQTNSMTDDPSGTLLSNSTAIHGEDDVPVVAAASSRNNRAPRPKLLMEYFKITLDLFFAIWFVIGNVWIFGGHASANDAPNLYRLCIVFLTFSCIGYAMPFILCLTICCCLPCIITTLGVTEDLAQTRGATSESINALPTHIFKTMKSKSNDESDNIPAVIEGGIVAEGTEKERMISGEDAVCCICIANYENDDELRELPCSHLFHKECVDKWLKINALCPLCKSEIGENVTGPVIEENANQQRGESRIENGLASTSS